jgi:3-deoxy-D-arabino-heptulosonate 7-phosphate (DAHP) synthase class II
MTAAWAAHEVLLQPDDLAVARTEGHPLQIVRCSTGESWSPPRTRPPAR